VPGGGAAFGCQRARIVVDMKRDWKVIYPFELEAGTDRKGE
jgi:hypothetical protein